MFLGTQVHQNRDMKCTSAGYQFLGDSLISWQCKKQQLTFAAEAKCVAASAACCSQVLWIQHQLKDYGLTYLNSTTYFDNDTAIQINKTLSFTLSFTLKPSTLISRCTLFAIAMTEACLNSNRSTLMLIQRIFLQNLSASRDSMSL